MYTKKHLFPALAATLFIGAGLHAHLTPGQAPSAPVHLELAPTADHAAALDGWICLDTKIFFPKKTQAPDASADGRLELARLLAAYETP